MLVVVAASAVCGGPAAGSIPSTAPDDPPAAPGNSHAPSSEESKSAPAAGSTGPNGPTYKLKFQFTPPKDLYFVIENEFRDSAGIPPLLAMTTWAKCRMTVTQQTPRSVREATTMNADRRNWPFVHWRCDRFEMQEQAGKSPVTYDSLRDSYPPPSLMDLAGIAKSQTSFLIDPETGKVADLKVVPTTVSAVHAARRNLSRTGEHCQWNRQSAEKLLNDIGPLYFPTGPVKIGETWSHSVSEAMKTFGMVTTQIHCTLRSVRRRGANNVASIEINGDISLVPESKQPPVPTTSRATTTSAPAAKKPRDFRIDRAAYHGTVEFDLTRGMLLQLSLRRELAFVADVSSPNSGPMQIKSGNEQILRVKTSLSPPPRPIIVGGPKPPVIPPEEMERSGRPHSRTTPSRGAEATTRPNLKRPVPATRSTSPAPRPATMPAAHPVRPLPPRPPASQPNRQPRPVRPS